MLSIFWQQPEPAGVFRNLPALHGAKADRTAFASDRRHAISTWLERDYDCRHGKPGEVSRRSLLTVRPSGLTGDFPRCHPLKDVIGNELPFRYVGARSANCCAPGSRAPLPRHICEFRSAEQAGVIRFTQTAPGICQERKPTAYQTRGSMFQRRRRPEATPQDQRELTDVELATVTGGVICSRDPATQFALWVATGFLPPSPNGPFLCWG